MRSPRVLLLAVALLAVTVTAWAGEDAVVDPKPAREKSVVAPTQKSADATKPDQPSQSRKDAVQAPEAKPEAVQAPQPEPSAVQTPTSAMPWESWGIAEPAAVSQSSGNGGSDHPPRGGHGGGGRGNGGHGGGHNNGGGHNYSGWNWHGPHEQWRHQHYHGSWDFLFGFGPVIYFAPPHYSYVIRLPHDRVGVYVRYAGEDHVGTQFADAVRQHLSDEGMRVVYSQDDAQLELYIISMEQDPEDAGYGSSISISYIWGPGHKFITAQMVDAGLNEVDDLAQSVVSYTNDLIDQYR
jgi:hypothetical protein